jgi:hypothetical protein
MSVTFLIEVNSFHPDWNDLKGAPSGQRAADANELMVETGHSNRS